MDGKDRNSWLASRLEVELDNGRWAQKPVPKSTDVNRARKSRNQVIQPITKAQLLRDGKEMLPEFKVNYINSQGSEVPYDRSGLPNHHTMGFTALTPEGLRYVYGIPAYNLTQEEIAFTAKRPSPSDSLRRADVGKTGDEGEPVYDNISGTQKYLKHVEMPKYAHSYLLTAIIGPDYVRCT